MIFKKCPFMIFCLTLRGTCMTKSSCTLITRPWEEIVGKIVSNHNIFIWSMFTERFATVSQRCIEKLGSHCFDLFVDSRWFFLPLLQLRPVLTSRCYPCKHLPYIQSPGPLFSCSYHGCSFSPVISIFRACFRFPLALLLSPFSR